MVNKQVRLLLIIGGLAVVAYVGWRWYQSRLAASGTSPTGTLGTNLNSIAPELVGGSSGPAVAPAVDVPVNITLSSTSTVPLPAAGPNNMIPVNHKQRHPVNAQTEAAGDSSTPDGAANVAPGVVSY
jgi:hypothetical protein